MRVTTAATKIHKWLALIIGIQILLWFASGLFMAHFPIEEVRGEDQIRKSTVQGFSPATAAARMAATLPPDGEAARLEVRPMLGRPVALVERESGRSDLYDVASGRRLSPISVSLAVKIARADYAGTGRVAGARLIDAQVIEYRGVLPAWRVDFDDGRDTAIYVSADSGKVTARRTKLWRIYDFFWALHIMDWKGRTDFNTWWLWLATAAALVAAIAGMMMLPRSFGLLRKRRR